MGILIKGGRLINAAGGADEIKDLYIESGVIKEIGENLPYENASEIIDAEGCLVMPGLVDMHVHLRDPGQTEKEDIETGTQAAAAGGVTTVVAMPNTTPVIDDPDRLSYVINKANAVGKVHVLQCGSLTKGMAGEELSDLEGMIKKGAGTFSEDGKSVLDAGLFREALKIAAKYDIPVLDHCEDMSLRGNGCMNEDENSKRLNLPGICNSTEDVIAARDIIIAKETGARLHLCHCSTYEVARMMQKLDEEERKQITAEVCPHHLLLTSDDIKTDDPNYKMNPPLRTARDVKALTEALLDGSISVISTDHAPHTLRDKTGSMRNAAFGIVGIETSFALMYTYFVDKGIMSINQLVEKMSYNPAKILGLSCGELAEGAPADVIIADTEHEYTIDKKKFCSKGRNTPFDGWKVKGKILRTICGGKTVYTAE